jgi:hypothetical protein
MIKGRIWTGPVNVAAIADALRAAFGYINVLQGTEHVYVINYPWDRHKLLSDIQQVMPKLPPSDLRVSTQNHPMRGKKP